VLESVRSQKKGKEFAKSAKGDMRRLTDGANPKKDSSNEGGLYKSGTGVSGYYVQQEFTSTSACSGDVQEVRGIKLGCNSGLTNAFACSEVSGVTTLEETNGFLPNDDNWCSNNHDDNDVPHVGTFATAPKAIDTCSTGGSGHYINTYCDTSVTAYDEIPGISILYYDSQDFCQAANTSPDRFYTVANDACFSKLENEPLYNFGTTFAYNRLKCSVDKTGYIWITHEGFDDSHCKHKKYESKQPSSNIFADLAGGSCFSTTGRRRLGSNDFTYDSGIEALKSATESDYAKIVCVQE